MHPDLCYVVANAKEVCEGIKSKTLGVRPANAITAGGRTIIAARSLDLRERLVVNKLSAPQPVAKLPPRNANNGKFVSH